MSPKKQPQILMIKIMSKINQGKLGEGQRCTFVYEQSSINFFFNLAFEKQFYYLCVYNESKRFEFIEGCYNTNHTFAWFALVSQVYSMCHFNFLLFFLIVCVLCTLYLLLHIIFILWLTIYFIYCIVLL